MWRITAVLACACAALTLAGGASSTTFGVADDAGKYSEDGGAELLPHAHGPRDDREPDGRLLGSGEAEHHRRPGFLRPCAAARDAPRHRGHLRDLPGEGPLARRHTERRRALRAVRGESRAALPLRPQGHLPERGQPAALPPAAVRRDRQGHLRLRAGAGDGRLLRRGQGGRPEDHGDRLRSLTARQRRLRSVQQRVALADPISRGDR